MDLSVGSREVGQGEEEPVQKASGRILLSTLSHRATLAESIQFSEAFIIQLHLSMTKPAPRGALIIPAFMSTSYFTPPDPSVHRHRMGQWPDQVLWQSQAEPFRSQARSIKSRKGEGEGQREHPWDCSRLLLSSVPQCYVKCEKSAWSG